ncbi:MAG: hypothetical protein M1820_000555 [Bogoriella megaspora]|nr:MAG: hypothetical protein M1820_000555 [Bogoriella megaspora]
MSPRATFRQDLEPSVDSQAASSSEPPSDQSRAFKDQSHGEEIEDKDQEVDLKSGGALVQSVEDGRQENVGRAVQSIADTGSNEQKAQDNILPSPTPDLAGVTDLLGNTSINDTLHNADFTENNNGWPAHNAGISSLPAPEHSQIRVDTNVRTAVQGGSEVPQDNAVGEQTAKSEIQSIMDQFDEGKGGPGEKEIMSPRLEIAQPQMFPPRSSSLEPIKRKPTSPDVSSPTGFMPLTSQATGQSATSKRSSVTFDERQGRTLEARALSPDATSSARSSVSTFKPPPPQPDPEPDLPFDFHRFLEQLRHRTADPVAKFLRSFLLEFGKKQWMVHEQVKIVSDFLEFISKKMAQCDVWRTVSDAEFDNAREGMEKLVMNRLYSQTFSPAIPPPEPTSSKNRKKVPQGTNGTGRTGQHQEDVERDEVLAQRVRIYGWVREEHLDIKPVGDKGRKFLKLAQQELIKINTYRAPRDKVICVLNCCKVIFGFLRNSKSDQSADSFVPLLIYTVLQANPDHIVSNVQYILRFRNQDKLGGEAGYYMSSLVTRSPLGLFSLEANRYQMGAVQFVEGLDRTSLTVSDEDFEKNVEAAVSAIAERHSEETKTTTPKNPPMVSEKSTLSRPEVTPRNSLEAERSSPLRRATASRNNTDASENEENAAVAGLLRTIQKPLSTIGRIFSDDQSETLRQPVSTPRPGATPRLSPSPLLQRQSSEDQKDPQSVYNDKQSQLSPAQQRLSAEDAAARQASAEAAEAQRIQRAEHKDVVEYENLMIHVWLRKLAKLIFLSTLAGMFPDLDREVISDVVRQKEGRVGLAVDACLALNN